MAYLLQVEPSCVVVWHMGADRRTPIGSRADLVAYLAAEATRLNVDPGELQVYQSSTMEFPTESTSDPAVLATVAELTAESFVIVLYDHTKRVYGPSYRNDQPEGPDDDRPGKNQKAPRSSPR